MIPKTGADHCPDCGAHLEDWGGFHWQDGDSVYNDAICHVCHAQVRQWAELVPCFVTWSLVKDKEQSEHIETDEDIYRDALSELVEELRKYDFTAQVDLNDKYGPDTALGRAVAVLGLDQEEGY